MVSTVSVAYEGAPGLRAGKRLKAMFRRREVLEALVRKDFEARYAGSLLGVAWTQLYPLLLLVVYTFVFGYIFHNQSPHFVIFLFIGIVLWSFFSTCFLLTTQSIVANGSLITKVNFPRELLTVSVVAMGLIDLALSHIILIAGVLFSGLRPSLSWIVLPALIALLALFCVGLGLILASAMVYLRDVRFFVDVGVLLLMFLSPIFYSAESVPENALWLMKANPLAVVILSYRQVILAGEWPALSSWLALIAAAFIMLWAGLEVFARAEAGFPDAL